MIETILEISVFMVAAVVLGLVLGWVLRGAMGSEQAELATARAQLRKIKKSLREQEAVNKAAADTATSEQAKAAEVKKPAEQPGKNTDSVVENTVATDEGLADKGISNKTGEKPTAAKSEKTSVAAKKPVAKKKSAGSKKKVAAKRKTLAEREADQAVAKQAFAEVTARIGTSEREDNLTKVYGVGKRYAEMLNELGLSSFEQLAKLRKAEVRTLAGALGVLDDRLEAEDWVGSAKVLAKESA